MLSLPASVRIFVAREPTDLRRSFDRLAAMVSEVLGEDPFSGHVFCFFNRRRDRAKLLVWDRGGFWLLYKRLEEGTFGVPGEREISGRELFLLLEGIEVVRERRRWSGPRKVEKAGKTASKVVLAT
jgi:transposase